jgi:hypothetical protein
MKTHIMRWAPQDWRTSKVRMRSAMTADPMLRLVYLELLFALHEAGGDLSADPLVLADELALPAAEIERALVVLGVMGKVVTHQGRIANPRVSTDLGRLKDWIAAQSEAGKKSAQARLQRNGTAQPTKPAGRVAPNGRSAPPERSFDGTERPFETRRTSPEPAVAVAVSGAVAVAGTSSSGPGGDGGASDDDDQAASGDHYGGSTRTGRPMDTPCPRCGRLTLFLGIEGDHAFCGQRRGGCGARYHLDQLAAPPPARETAATSSVDQGARLSLALEGAAAAVVQGTMPAAQAIPAYAEAHGVVELARDPGVLRERWARALVNAGGKLARSRARLG